MGFQGTHNLQRCVATISAPLAGLVARRVTGWGETDGIARARDENRYNKKYGADGEASRSRLNANGGTVTFTIAQTNVDMLAFFKLIENIPEGLDLVDINFTSLDTGETWAAPLSWLQKEPDEAWNKESGDRVYVFDVPEFLG